jgi:8-oxo-dGTP diphosphatase
MLPANTFVLKALELPAQYAITNAGESGEKQALERLDLALSRGLRLVQVREKLLTKGALEKFASEVVQRCHDHGARVMINGDADLAAKVAADGVHLPAARLFEVSAPPPGFYWCGASCHDRREIEQAEAIGVDFIVLGPVKRTASHPQAKPLGWHGFREFASDASIPVYALGGILSGDLEEAWRNSAHGIAMQRGAWLD